MSMNDMSISDFAEKLASKEAVPGGGGAAAFAGALAAALGSMVGNLTAGKDAYKEYEEDIKKLLEESEKLRLEFLDCIDEDAKVFEPLSKVYKLSADALERDELMEKCLADAAMVPLKLVKLSCRAIELAEEYSKKGSRLLLSDAGCSSILAWSCLYAAVLNVRVNTKLMKDREFAQKINKEAEEYMNKYWKIADNTYEYVYKELE